MPYIAYHFTVTPPQPGSEILMACLGELPFESFDSTDTGFTAYIREQDDTGLNLEDFLLDDFTFTYTTERIEDNNWNEEWEKNFEPIVIDDKLTIRAPFHSPSKTRYELIIMPKMSFGTGHHQTTRLVCRQMMELELIGKSVLDMGCGTGVLAILAAKLGAKKVLGIDIDEWCVENSLENCRENGYPEIEIKKGGVELLDAAGKFDVILANINKNILKTQMNAYSHCSGPGTKLLLSGFFTTDVEELKVVTEANGFRVIRSTNENEWAMMLCEHN